MNANGNKTFLMMMIKELQKVRGENCKNKLRTYRLFKTTYNFENYLVDVKNIKHRKNPVTKFRISAHNLEIGRGRFKGNVFVSERICTNCSREEVENELHIHTLMIIINSFGFFSTKIHSIVTCNLAHFIDQAVFLRSF